MARSAVTLIEQCMHWGGEEPYDDKRARFLAKSIERDCPKAVDVARRSYRVLKSDPAGALNLITLNAHFGSQYGADTLIPVNDQDVICAIAYREVQRRLAQDPTEYFPYFEMKCPGKIKANAQ